MQRTVHRHLQMVWRAVGRIGKGTCGTRVATMGEAASGVSVITNIGAIARF